MKFFVIGMGVACAVISGCQLSCGTHTRIESKPSVDGGAVDDAATGAACNLEPAPTPTPTKGRPGIYPVVPVRYWIPDGPDSWVAISATGIVLDPYFVLTARIDGLPKNARAAEVDVENGTEDGMTVFQTDPRKTLELKDENLRVLVMQKPLDIAPAKLALHPDIYIGRSAMIAGLFSGGILGALQGSIMEVRPHDRRWKGKITLPFTMYGLFTDSSKGAGIFDETGLLIGAVSGPLVVSDGNRFDSPTERHSPYAIAYGSDQLAERLKAAGVVFLTTDAP